MEKTFAIFLGGRLRDERKRMGLNQEELADACGVSRPMFGKYERGLAAPGAEVLAALQGQGIDVTYLLGTELPSRPTTPALTAEEQVLLDYFRAAPPAVRRAALGALVGAAPGSVHQTGGINQNVTATGSVVAGGNVYGAPAARKRPPR